jgi:hypothetical protein
MNLENTEEISIKVMKFASPWFPKKILSPDDSEEIEGAFRRDEGRNSGGAPPPGYVSRVLRPESNGWRRHPRARKAPN